MTTRVVRTRGLTVAAADAPVIIDHDDAVLLLPRRLDRADVHARRVVAVLALHGHIELVGARHRVHVVGGGLLEVDRAHVHLKHADVGVVGRAVVVVLFVACLGAVAAADADAQIQRIAEFHALDRAVGADLNLYAVALQRVGLKPAQRRLQLLRRELFVVALQEILGRGRFGEAR